MSLKIKINVRGSCYTGFIERKTMTTFTAVFTDTEDDLIFWGAFPNALAANEAVKQYVADHSYWNIDEFIVKEFPFAQLL